MSKRYTLKSYAFNGKKVFQVTFKGKTAGWNMLAKPWRKTSLSGSKPSRASIENINLKTFLKITIALIFDSLNAKK